MVAAIVTHDASRSLDPQLHTHVCVMNVTFDPVESRWKGVQPNEYYRRQGFFREVCYNRLAASMLDAGYELELVRGIGFNVKGVPADLRDRFSKRRRTILEQAAECGAVSQDALQTVARQTREAKTHANAKNLAIGWQNEAGEELQRLQEAVATAKGAPKPMEPVSAAKAVESAEAHLFERSSVIDEHVLLREALIAARGQVTLDQVKQAVADRVRIGALIRSGREIASRDGLVAEQEFTAWAGRSMRNAREWGKLPPLDGLGEDQTAAVKGVMAARSRVLILQGDAGTGKTTSLKAIVRGIELGGGRVFGCAPSAGAADVLRQELTAEADTLQQLLVNPSLQAATRGRVILVDEAGLVSVREMRDLCRLAAANSNRLLLVGDTKQHSSVEAGDAVRCLQRYAQVPVFRLTEIRRQRDPGYRRAVAMLAKGEALRAFDQFERLGAVRQIADLPSMFRAAAEAYVRSIQRGQSCLAISPVWSEIHRFTDAVRLQLKAAGLLAGTERMVPTVLPLQWTREERRRVEHYQPGDQLTFYQDTDVFRKHEVVTVVRREGRELVVRTGTNEEMTLDPRQAGSFSVGLPKEIPVSSGDRLLIRANLKSAGLRNGDLVGVEGFGADGSILLVDGRQVPSWFREFSHGYATTSHAAQGKSVDHGILLMADGGYCCG
ncbi:MAG: AAA family ATPase [Opitutaceae bacterium]